MSRYGVFISDLDDLKYFFLSSNFEKGHVQREVLEPISIEKK